MDIGPGELVIVLLIVVVLFGANRLPKLARSLGEAAHELRKYSNGGGDETAEADTAATAPTEVAQHLDDGDGATETAGDTATNG